jgi:hypothetical protein
MVKGWYSRYCIGEFCMKATGPSLAKLCVKKETEATERDLLRSAMQGLVFGQGACAVALDRQRRFRDGRDLYYGGDMGLLVCACGVITNAFCCETRIAKYIRESGGLIAPGVHLRIWNKKTVLGDCSAAL